MAEIFKPLRIWTNEDIVNIIQRVKQHHVKFINIATCHHPWALGMQWDK
jgi:hypothetical protein